MPRQTVKPATYPYGLKPNLHSHLGDTDLAYIAGLIDGEGCIRSSYPLNGNTPLAITVAMIHRPTLEWLFSHCGGKVSARRSNQANARPSWCWTLKGIRSASLLKRLRKFMVTKAEEADVAIELGSTFWVNQIRGRLHPDVIAKRNQLGQTLRDLKRRTWADL